jgi:Ca2+-binding RTX toxin-like protein
MRRFSPAFLVPVVALAGSLVGPSAASAVTQVGETFPGATGSCDTGTALQSISPGSPPQYAAPSAGVITAWSFHATPIAPTLLKLKVARPAGGNTFTIVGESPPKSPAGGVLSTYTDVRIAVNPGDVIGFYVESASDDAECFRSAPGFGFHFGIDQPPGSTAEYIPSALSSQMSISAVLEPDCDKDGLGDETQDTDTASCTCRGLPATIVGTSGNDVRTGTPGRDVMLGLEGNDTLSGLSGNDVLCGAKGNDTLKGGKGKDTLLGQKGNDNLKGGPGKDKLSGKAGEDRLKGAGGNDKLKGGGGKDVCIGGKANDSASKCEVEKSI